jgi:hypothetical protein
LRREYYYEGKSIGFGSPSPLEQAIYRNNKDIVRLLLSKHKPAQISRFRTILEFHQIMLMTEATYLGYGRTVSKVFFGTSLNINDVNTAGRTPLDLAVSGTDDDFDVWEMMEERGAWSSDDLRAGVRLYIRTLRVLFLVAGILLVLDMYRSFLSGSGIWTLSAIFSGGLFLWVRLFRAE